MITPSGDVICKVLGFSELPDGIELVKRGSYNNNIKQTILIWYNDGSMPIEINMYEFVQMCKDYLLEQYQIIGTFYSTSVRGWCCWVGDIGNKYIGRTEAEAIYSAIESDKDK